MSEMRYVRNCLYCGKVYIARSLKSKFDSDKCRGAFNRIRRKDMIVNGLAPQTPTPIERDTYTEQDVWILMGRICKAELGIGSTLHEEAHVEKERQNLIADFEKRFSCNFESLKEKYPHIFTVENHQKKQAIADHYHGMEYSRKRAAHRKK
jgi:hypothetical protein